MKNKLLNIQRSPLEFKTVFSSFLSLGALLAVLFGATGDYQIKSVDSLANNPNDICVNVFRDYNSDGNDDGAGEPGISGVTVTAYDNVGNATTFTPGAAGVYTFTPGNADQYRIEVTGLMGNLEPSVAGATTTFFTTRGNTIDVGLHEPAEYFPDDEVFVSIPCYVDGPSNGSNADMEVLVVVPADEYTAGIGNLDPTSYYVATHRQIGSTFGVAYSRAAESIFASAFTKRHAAFGPGGTGAIYQVPLTSTVAPITSGTPSVFLDLDTYFGNDAAGENPHPDNIPDFNRDPDTYDAVGKVGLGGLALSEEENTLWTINLLDRRLYEIPLAGTPENPTPPASASDISRWPASGDLTDLIGLPGSDADKDENIRPFAVKCYRGAIYIGLVATGESSVQVNTNTGEITNTGNQSLMQGFVYKFDPVSDQFTQVLSFPLNYIRGQAIDFCSNNAQAEFFPWTPIYDKATMEAAVVGSSRRTNGADGQPDPVNDPTPDDLSPERAYPQAWLTDITFDEAGKMIIGIRDRFADQHGFKKLPPTTLTDDPNLVWNADGAGDLLVASPNTTDGGATYVLENNSRNGTNGEPFGPTTGANQQEGPGNGEFFFDDRYRPSNFFTGDGGGVCPGIDNITYFGDPNDMDPLLNPQLELGHDEISLGGVFNYNGRQVLIASAYDPIDDYDNFNNAGFLALSTVNGSRQGAALVYASQDFEQATDDNFSTFGKGNGLGDVEGVAPPAPIEVGNRVWLDDNENGIQDPGEDGINGVTVELYKDINGTMTKVAETITAADPVQGNGAYRFSASPAQAWENGQTEVLPEMDYEIRVDLASVQGQNAGVTAFTTAGANTTNDNKTDLSDSDATPTGVIAFRTGLAGENNPTLDIGAIIQAVCTITVDNAVPSLCAPQSNTYTLDVTVTYADAPAGEMITITTDNGANQSFSPAGAAGTETFTVTGLTSDGVADIDVTATFATTTTCTNTSTDAYTAPDDCSPVCSITVDNAVPSVCDPQSNTYTLDVTVTYADAPAGEMITITTDNGASQSFSPAGAAGTETFMVTSLTSDGIADIDVTAMFATTTSCTNTSTDAYDAPTSCAPVCSITVDNASPSVCDPQSNTYTLDVTVTYANAPAGEMITITTDNGGSQSFSPASAAGTETFTVMGLISDGVADIDVTAAFSTQTTCSNTSTDAYTAPADCAPVCSITVDNAVPSVCNPQSNTYTLDVTVTYADAPAGEMIAITTDNGGSQSFTPAGAAGTETFTVTGLTSDGTADIDVAAMFATTTSCTNTNADVYDAPADCSPVCMIAVELATPSPCDPNTNTYDLDVTVTYVDAPAGEMITITTDNGGSQSFTLASAAGTETFTVTGLTSDGTTDIDVTAT
ncbi:MAG: SdrD B-like domain-containing protein, partial [Bacteroidota bacterium]